MHRRTCHTVALLLAIAATCHRGASADLIWSWRELDAQRSRRGGLFATWAPDQGQVLTALLSAEQAGRAGGLEALEERVAQHPRDVAGRDLLARAYLRRRRVGAAIEQFRAALAIDGKSRSSRLCLADIYQAAGRTSAAARELAELVRLDPEAEAARRRLAALRSRQGKHREAAELLSEAVELAPEHLRTRLLLIGALLRSGQAADAAAVAEAAARLAPDALEPRFLLADCHRARGDLAAAAAQLEALARGEAGRAARQRLALVRLLQGQFAAAQTVCREILDADRRDAVALSALAIAAQAQGDYSGAAEACRRLREVHQPLASLLLANVWLGKGDATAVRAVCGTVRGKEGELVAAYEKLLGALEGSAAERREVALRMNLGVALQRIGWGDDAIATLSAALRLVPRSAVVGEMLANAYAASARRAEQLATWETIARGNPDSAAAARVLARLYAAEGQPERAKATCEAVLARWPEDAHAHALLATLALRRGNDDAATEHAEAAFRALPAARVAYRGMLDALLAGERFAEAAQAVRDHAEAAPDAVRRPLERAIEALAAGDLAVAREQCELGIQRSSVDARLRYLAGIVLERQGDAAGAVGHYQVAVLAEPGYLPAGLRLGRAALRAGRASLALAAFRAATAAGPDVVEAHVGVADALSQAGRGGEAAAHLRAVAARLARAGGPAWRTIQARLAQELLAVGDSAGAIAAAEAVLADEPDQPVARRAACGAYRRLGNLAGAARVYERIVARDAKADVDAELGLLRLVQGRFAEAAERLGRAGPAARTARRGDLLLAHAAARIALGQADRARGAMEQALAAGIGLGRPSALVIVALAASGAEAKAREQLEALKQRDSERAARVAEALPRLAGDPALAGAFLASGCASARGWRRQAVALIASARAREPELPLLLDSEARRCLEAGILGRALTAARELVRVRPKAGDAHFLLARVLAARGQPEAAAAADLKAAAFLPKQNAARWAVIAQGLAAAGKTDAAIDAYRTVLAIDPNLGAAANNLAWLYASEKPGELAEAQRMAARAVEASPDVAAFRDTLGWILFLRKQFDEALRELQAADKLAPDQANYIYHLGMVHFAMGRGDEARRLLERALRLDPKLPDADTARATLKLLKPESRPKPPR